MVNTKLQKKVKGWIEKLPPYFITFLSDNSDYLLSLFDKEIDPCFAYLWDEDKAIEKVNSIYKLISEIIKEILDSHLSESEIVKLIRNKLITINNNC